MVLHSGMHLLFYQILDSAEKITMYKHTSLFVRNLSDEEKFYNAGTDVKNIFFVTTTRPNKLECWSLV